MKKLFFAALSSLISVGLGAFSAPTRGQMPEAVRQALAQQGISAASVGIIARPVSGVGNNTGVVQSLVKHNERVPFNPASVMKLVTSYTGLIQLGSDYRWQTGMFLNGELQGDTFTGDVVIRGGGDPKLVIEDLQAWLASWRRAGLRVIRGDLILDESLYERMDPSMEPFDGDTSQPYNVRPNPLMMNFKAVKFIVSSDSNGQVSVTTDPQLADVRIESRIQTVSGPCRYRAAGLTVTDIAPDAVRLQGQISRSCGETYAFSAALDHRPFVNALIKATWKSAGGEWQGHFKQGQAKGREWSVWNSPRSLIDVVRDINKFSNNVMTRQVLLQMGHASTKQQGTIERGRQAVEGILRARGLQFPELIIENGSGLSRIERISPESLSQLLIDANQASFATEFRESLPVVGVDGTMKARLSNSPVAGNAWIKTGSIAAVNSIAGYVRGKSGQMYAVAFIVNGPNANRSQLAQDLFLQWVFEKG